MSMLERIRFRRVAPTDIPRCLELEQASYPPDEAASKSALQYRQHHAAPYFRCAILLSESAKKTLATLHSSTSNITTGIAMTPLPTTTTTTNTTSGSSSAAVDDVDDDKARIVGFVCGTRCSDFGAASMRPGSHDPNGTVLAIHSVVVDEEYRRQGVATAMVQDYVRQIEYDEERKIETNSNNNNKNGYNYNYYDTPPIERLVLLSKQNLLPFYLKCGFAVMHASDIAHGSDVWYHCERPIQQAQQYALSYWVVDSFAARSQPVTGNPAAVVLLLDEPRNNDPNNNTNESIDDNSNNKLPRSKEWMQMVAREFNLSETTFCWPKQPEQLLEEEEEEDSTSDNGEKRVVPEEWNILYFTPQTEVALCGHATLAAAHVIALNNNINNKVDQHQMIFHATNDVLKATVIAEGVCDSVVTMDFPAILPQPCENEQDRVELAEMVQTALNIAPTDILYIGLTAGLGDVLFEVTKESFFQIGYSGLKLNALEQDVSGYTRGFIICCCDAPSSVDENDGEPRKSNSINNSNHGNSFSGGASSGSSTGATTIDFWSRFFAPKAGIAEDPVTGSAHCVLAPYFGQKLQTKRVVGKQMSARTGIVECVWKPEEEPPIVQITGNAVTMMQGTLRF